MAMSFDQKTQIKTSYESNVNIQYGSSSHNYNFGDIYFIDQ